MEKHTITLAYPVEFQGVTVSELSFRRPKGGDVRRLQESKGSDIVKSFKLMSDLAEVDPKLIEELDPVDIDAINDWLEPILDPQKRRGDTT